MGVEWVRRHQVKYNDTITFKNCSYLPQFRVHLSILCAWPILYWVSLNMYTVPTMWCSGQVQSISQQVLCLQSHTAAQDASPRSLHGLYRRRARAATVVVSCAHFVGVLLKNMTYCSCECAVDRSIDVHDQKIQHALHHFLSNCLPWWDAILCQ